MQALPYNAVAFDSMADLADHMRPDMTAHQLGPDAWYDGIKADQALQMLATGDTSCVPEAEKLLSQFDFHLATTGTQLDLSPAGFMPCVPAYIGGEPECMYDMVRTESDTQPIKVIVAVSSSAGVSPETIRRRGTVILAAVMALAAVRPVQLEVLCMAQCRKSLRFKLPATADDPIDRDCSVASLRVTISSAPLDLALAGYALSHAGFARHILYNFYRHEFLTAYSTLSWPEVAGLNLHKPRHAEVIAATLRLLGEDPDHTLLIPAAHLHDPIVDSPKAWVASVLARYGQTELA